jgi:hypothetical protein
VIFSTVVAGLCAALVAAVSIILILHHEYEDGLIGRIALSGLGLGAIVRVTEIVSHGASLPVTPVGVLIWISLAMFLGRHLFRFIRWKHSGDYDWRAIRK